MEKQSDDKEEIQEYAIFRFKDLKKNIALDRDEQMNYWHANFHYDGKVHEVPDDILLSGYRAEYDKYQYTFKIYFNEKITVKMNELFSQSRH